MLTQWPDGVQAGSVIHYPADSTSVWHQHGRSANLVTKCWQYEWTKRTFDILGSCLLSIMAMPVCVIIALIIPWDGGPVLFRQIRVGQGGRLFMMLKFRTMRVDAEANGPQYAAVDDDRVIWIGRILRRYRLDELPQLLNVLRGDMSLIGPRPERPEFIHDLRARRPDLETRITCRHAVRPGLTGLAQILDGYCNSILASGRKFRWDSFYVQRRSWRLDWLIICKTIPTVLWGKGQ